VAAVAVVEAEDVEAGLANALDLAEESNLFFFAMVGGNKVDPAINYSRA
jgi:hypothetical protein